MPQVILVPDNIDDINPPGYVESGSLEGVLSSDPVKVSGNCIGEEECSEWWCTDNGCPPGCWDLEAGCPPGCGIVEDDNGYPTGPPKITECLKQSYGRYAYSCDTPHGIFNVTRSWLRLSSYDDMSTIWGFSYTTDIAGVEFTGVHYIEETDEVLASGTIDDMTNSYGQYRGCIVRLNALTGEVLQVYKIEDDAYWALGGKTAVSALDCFYYNGAVYMSGLFIYQQSHDNKRAGYMYWDVTTGEMLGVVGAMIVRDATPTRAVLNKKTGTIFVSVGAHRFGSPAPMYYAGKIFAIEYPNGTPVEITEGVKAADPYDYTTNELLGSKMHIFDDYLVLVRGWNTSDVNYESSGNYSVSHDIDLYNPDTYEFIKTVTTPYPNYPPDPNNSSRSNQFGFSISNYGNFYLLGSPGEALISTDSASYSRCAGGVYLYDSDFDLVKKLNHSPVANGQCEMGAFVGMNADKIIFGDQNFFATNYVSVCTYENFGI